MNELDSKIMAQIDVAAFFLAQENFTYDKLCWMLSQRRLIAEKDPRFNNEERIREKAAEIFFINFPYDVLCWFIAEIDILMKFGKI